MVATCDGVNVNRRQEARLPRALVAFLFLLGGCEGRLFAESDGDGSVTLLVDAGPAPADAATVSPSGDAGAPELGDDGGTLPRDGGPPLVGDDGGTRDLDPDTGIDIPPGALAEPAPIEVVVVDPAPVLPRPFDPAGSAVGFRPYATALAMPATIRVACPLGQLHVALFRLPDPSAGDWTLVTVRPCEAGRATFASVELGVYQPATARILARVGDEDVDGDGLATSAELLGGSEPDRVDTDRDGLSDRVEAMLGTDPRSFDSDGDRYADLHEYLWQHRPLDPVEESPPSVILGRDRDDDELPDDAEEVLGTDPNVADTDGDGILDGLEDTDGDGVPDGLEFRFGTDPRNPLSPDANADGVSDATLDFDGDGLTNAEELAAGTHPFRADSDFDHLGDGAELSWGTSPSAVDADMDFLSDMSERVGGFDPSAADTDGDSISDFEQDLDGDGLRDFVEHQLGTDPMHVDSDRDGVSDADGDLDGDTLNNLEEHGFRELPTGTFFGGTWVYWDRDSDGLTNALDPDDDNDGIPTSTEVADSAATVPDVDGDSFVNWRDRDADDMWLADAEEGRLDEDGDGIVAYLDPDEGCDHARDPEVARLLTERTCERCDLQGACLADTDLRGITFSSPRFGEVNLARADLSGARFEGHFDFRDGVLAGARFRGAVFPVDVSASTSMDGVYARGADFSGAMLGGGVSYRLGASTADFRDAVFDDARFVSGPRFAASADFSRSDFRGASFQRVLFDQNVSFRLSDLRNTRFDGARFSERATFSGAEMCGSNVDGATFDDPRHRPTVTCP